LTKQPTNSGSNDRAGGIFLGGLLAVLGGFLAASTAYCWMIEGNPGAVSDAAYNGVTGALVFIGLGCVGVGVACIVAAIRGR